MKILYGTTNNAKLELMRRAISPLGIEVLGLQDIEGEIPDIPEVGQTPLENARIKASAYFEAFGMPVFPATRGCILTDCPRMSNPEFTCDG